MIQRSPSRRTEAMDAAGIAEPFELLPDSELGCSDYVVLFRSPLLTVPMNIDVVEDDLLFRHLVAATDVDLIANRVDDDGDAVQFPLVLVESAHSGSGRRSEVAVESRLEIHRDILRSAALDPVARHEVDQLSIFEQRDGGAAGRNVLEVAPGLLGGLGLLSGKYRSQVIGASFVLQSQMNSRPRLPCGAAANRIDDQQSCSLHVGHERIDIVRCQELLKPDRSQLRLHGVYYQGTVRHYYTSWK